MSTKTQAPFQSLNSGKCDTCLEQKPLDSMVRKSYKKGLYECIDCKVSIEEVTSENYNQIMNTPDGQEMKIKAGALKKLIKWAFG